MLPAGVDALPLGRVSFYFREAGNALTAGLEAAGASHLPTYGAQAIGEISLARVPDGVGLKIAFPSYRATHQGVYFDLSADLTCSQESLVGIELPPCSFAARACKVGATACQSLALKFHAAPDTRLRPDVNVTMRMDCVKLHGAAGTREWAALVSLPVFDFSLAALSDTLRKVSDFAYRDKAALLAAAADLEPKIFVLNALEPFFEGIDTAFFRDRVWPSFQAARSLANSEAGIEGLRDIPRTPATGAASLRLLVPALAALKEGVTDPAMQAPFADAIAKAGAALAQGSQVERVRAVFAGLDRIAAVIDGMTAAGRHASHGLLVLALREHWR